MARRIAVVEDDATIRANYADALTKHGYEVSSYADHAQAIAAFRTRLPDLALLDIGLGTDVDGGICLCQELRAPSGAEAIILFPRRRRDFDKQSRLRLGADHYPTKKVSVPP